MTGSECLLLTGWDDSTVLWVFPTSHLSGYYACKTCKSTTSSICYPANAVRCFRNCLNILHFTFTLKLVFSIRYTFAARYKWTLTIWLLYMLCIGRPVWFAILQNNNHTLEAFIWLQPSFQVFIVVDEAIFMNNLCIVGLHSSRINKVIFSDRQTHC